MIIAELVTIGWHGTTYQRVDVVDILPKRYRIKALTRTRLPRKTLDAGALALVPKSAIRFREERYQ